MNWDAIAAIGQIVRAFAVVLSLAYLGAQIRQNTTGVRRGTTAEAFTAVRDWGYHIIADPSIRQAFLRGSEGLENLSDDETAQYWALIFNFFKTAEVLHFQYINGAMDEGVWAGWEKFLSAYSTTTGSLQYYRERRQFFSPRFQEWVDEHEPQAGFSPLGQKFETNAEQVGQ